VYAQYRAQLRGWSVVCTSPKVALWAMTRLVSLSDPALVKLDQADKNTVACEQDDSYCSNHYMTTSW
jgi:hypothetical protein